MAEVHQVQTVPTAGRGAFKATMEAIASNDPKRIAQAEDDALTALLSVGSMLNVVADYVYLRAQHPKDALYATELDVADAVYSISDLSTCIHSALMEASNARFELRANSEKTTENKSKEG